jgi:iron complex outermembrane receptor protein
MPAIRSLLLVAAAVSAGPALAQEAPAVDAEDPLHGGLGPDVVVTAPFVRERFALPTAVGVLEGEALARETRGTIGETLARQPGVSATWFGPGSSRPILRGLEGERIRVLTDGIGSFDVSNTSVDHAVAINPLLAERVEVVRGPASLLFGSSAIGGVVNVTDRRIAREIPDEPVHLEASGVLASAARDRGLGGSIDVPLGRGGLVLHGDGSFAETGNYRTGGYVFSDRLRAEAEEIGGEVAEQAQARGRVDNSDTRTWQAGGGLSSIGSGGSFGFAVSRFESNYGIPNGLELDEHDEEEEGEGEEEGEEGHGHGDIRLDVRQTRIDARAELPLTGAFERLNFRFGWADYVHDEVEPSGEIGTTFENEALEARAELVQREAGGWRGATGVQFLARNFEAAGEEAYVPRNLTEQLGLFTLQSFDLGRATLELGGRYEHASVRPVFGGEARSFDSFSVSGGVSIPLGLDWRIALSVAHSERAPAAEELFADGPHAATGTFEIGDPDLAKERSTGVEAIVRGRGEGWRLELAGFFNRFSNFIYLSPTGEEEDELPVFAYRQDGARYWGLEAEAAVTVARAGDTRFELVGLADFVRADLLDGGGPVPRIPPFRFVAGIEATGGPVGGRVDVEHVTRQTRVAAFETETPAYTLVNASLAWRPFGPDNATAIIASANNILDVEARRHSSFLKDIAPLPGRDFRLSARFSF